MRKGLAFTIIVQQAIHTLYVLVQFVCCDCRVLFPRFHLPLSSSMHTVPHTHKQPERQNEYTVERLQNSPFFESIYQSPDVIDSIIHCWELRFIQWRLLLVWVCMPFKWLKILGEMNGSLACRFQISKAYTFDRHSIFHAIFIETDRLKSGLSISIKESA